MSIHVAILQVAATMTVFTCVNSFGDDVQSIIDKIDANQANKTSYSVMSMTTFPDATDEGSRRDMKVQGYSRGTDDSYMEFLEPKTIKGLRILSRGDDRWVYFPSTGRSRKIAGESKKESVKGVGGDFSYEDMGGGTMKEKYSIKLLKDDNKTWVLEGIPKKESAYTKLIFYVDKQTYVPMKTEYHTADDGHYKELIAENVKQIAGRWNAMKMTMLNLKKNRKTVIILHKIDIDVPVDEKYFDSNRFFN